MRQRKERMLASTTAASGETVAGSRDALFVGDRRIPWEEVEAADWDSDSDTLRVSEVGAWGEERREHSVVLEEPGRLLELVRERVTASVLLQRHVRVRGRRGVRVVARRAPSGDRPIAWFFEYDEGVDPDDPEVRAAATATLASCREEVGDGPDLRVPGP